MAYPFLSDQWVEHARRLRHEYQGKVPTVGHLVRMNLVVTEVPFGSGELLAYLDTSEGLVDIELGQLEPADLRITVDYVTAKEILVGGNTQAGMQAFMAGKVRVEGDVGKLMALQTNPDEATRELAQELATRIRDITE